eukprot:2307031-Lingulodinium_polyedra.AAC.1
MAAAVCLSPPGRSSWVAAYSPTVLQSSVSVTSLWRPAASGITVSSWGAPRMRFSRPICASTGALSLP